MLDEFEHRQRGPRDAVYPDSLLTVALRTPPNQLPLPARMFEFDGGLKRSWWKRG